MKSNRNLALSLAPAVASLLLAIGVATLFSACGMKEDGTWMRCHDAQTAVMWVAIATTVVLAMSAFIKNGKARAILSVLGAVAALVTFALPGAIMPMCMMQTMRCYAAMQPFTRIMSAIVFVLCIVAAVSSWRQAAKSRPSRGL